MQPMSPKHPPVDSPVDAIRARSVWFAEPQTPRGTEGDAPRGGRLSLAVDAGRSEIDGPNHHPGYGRPVSEFPIQRVKVQRPPLLTATLERDRLLDWLSVQIHHRVVLITAEAGFGKTTLLADFTRRTRVRTAWYRLDEDDRNFVSFLNYVVAAGREAVPGFAPVTTSLLEELGSGGPTQEVI